jgi:trehalose 6-phosphate phosphatase
MRTPPPIPADAALFLDFDGTLVALAPTPDAIEVPADLVPMLGELHARLDGALAIVTGRQIASLDRFLAPLRLPAAGEHGVQRRDASGCMRIKASSICADVLDACRRLARRHPGLLVECKQGAVALHYRLAPEAAALCRDTLARLLEGRPQLELLQGKCVLEVKPAGVSKGRAIADFLLEPPFAGRRPMFVGDDLTDESGFEVVQARAGIAVKVGAGPSMAQHRLGSVQAVGEWLSAGARQEGGR